jgi:hypothetical protein
MKINSIYKYVLAIALFVVLAACMSGCNEGNRHSERYGRDRDSEPRHEEHR